MRILSIGNSFSQDAHRWLHDMAAADGQELYTVNLYIGGCSLERHAQNIAQDAAAYDREINGQPADRRISIAEALRSEPWDVVTVQQVSGYSGRPQSYIPYLTAVTETVRTLAPQAALWIHETWAYETDSGHGDFIHYNRDQQEMFRRLTDAYAMASRLVDAPLLRVGETVQYLRCSTAAFRYTAGGRSLCRDGFHLSLDYGRYAAAAVWYMTLTGADVRRNRFAPVVDGVRAEEELLQIIRDAVYTVLSK